MPIIHAVDDDAAHRLILEHVLADAAGGLPVRIHGGVAAAAEAIAADRKAGSEVFVLCDLNLADGTAMDLAARLDIASDDGVAMAVLSSVDPAPLGLEAAGIDAFLEKPLDLDELGRAIEGLFATWLAKPS